MRGNGRRQRADSFKSRLLGSALSAWTDSRIGCVAAVESLINKRLLTPSERPKADRPLSTRMDKQRVSQRAVVTSNNRPLFASDDQRWPLAAKPPAAAKLFELAPESRRRRWSGSPPCTLPKFSFARSRSPSVPLQHSVLDGVAGQGSGSKGYQHVSNEHVRDADHAGEGN